MEIPEQIALVTGATSGIGKAITLALSKAGFQVIALGRDPVALEQMQHTSGVRPLALDLLDREALAGALQGEKIDVLVNNAGVIPPAVEFDQMDQNDIDATIAVNLSASLATTRLVLPGMMARKHGHVFFIGSTAGQAAFPSMAVYGATKAAISSFAVALRCDISGSGVRVTEIVAGRVETNLYKEVLNDQARTDMYGAFDAVQPEDVAAMLLSVLQMPAHVDVTRFDILPTAQFVGGGGFAKKDNE
ncbi:NADP-dependent 3-hydroxy acid dehydrogenase YdfG [Roseovarius albus]|uniref:NADP-dependent 3-hydroxy acid dehydrogenase YdfG n=1 Tax=Roseovarius albus TaxID=1247867 RepID=A0A1X6Z7Z4_9RHOB|nr:SDR family oxidoreductase [Roseovarius albus]SLN42803.1 NADP-dependent 3-hydroxy acid dehydrogenase YdfG [Roseovarius albus]